MKPVRLSRHATMRAFQRGTAEEQIVECIGQSPRRSVGGGRFVARKTFTFGAVSPMNNQFYRFKTIEPIFGEEADEIAVVTVKVYSSNEEKG